MHNIYIHNWYNRNAETYSYGMPVNVNEEFTKTLYSMIEAKSLLSNYHSLSKELLDIVSTRFNIKPQITISTDEDETYTNGRKIVISANKFKDLSNYKAIDMSFGLCFHEVAHCLYTDWDILRTTSISCNPITQFIHNLLEDEEIEIRLSKQNTGYAKYFAYIKDVIFGNGTCSETALKEKRVNQLDEIMAILFCVIRYPKHIGCIGEELLTKYSNLFIKINDILVNNDCPGVVPFTDCDMYDSEYYSKVNITKSTTKATFEIYKYLSEYIGQDFKNQESEVDGNSGSIKNSISNGDAPASLIAVCYDDDVYSGSTSADTEVSKSNDKVRTPNPDKYFSMVASMKPYYKAIENTIIPNDIKLKDNLVINRFRRNGNLDTNRLAEAMQNINTIYTQRFNKPIKVNNAEPKYAFVIMIDESGSMNVGNKSDFTHSIAALYADLFAKFPSIEYFVYGHGDKINPYITKEKRNRYVLGNYDKQGGQDDAYAYEWIINDVKRQTSLPIIVLNITDFYYHANDKALARVINNFKKNNVSFNMLTIGNKHTLREENFCRRLLEGQVLHLSSWANENENLRVLLKLSEMLRKNYERFNRK